MAKNANLLRPTFVFFGCGDKIVNAIGNNNQYTSMIFGAQPVVIRLTAEEIGWQARAALGNENYAKFLRMIVDGVVAEQGIDPVASPNWNKNVGLLILGGQFNPEDASTKTLLKSLFPRARYFGADSYATNISEIWRGRGRQKKAEPQPIGDAALMASLAHGMENFPIEELEFGVRTYNCLKRVGVETIGDLVMQYEQSLAEIPNFGKKSQEEVLEVMERHGLSLRKSDASS